MCTLCDNFLNHNSDVLRTAMRPAQVRDWYVESFNELRSFPRIQVQHGTAGALGGTAWRSPSLAGRQLSADAQPGSDRSTVRAQLAAVLEVDIGAMLAVGWGHMGSWGHMGQRSRMALHQRHMLPDAQLSAMQDAMKLIAMCVTLLHVPGCR